MPNLSGRTSGHNFSLQYRNNCGEKVFPEKVKSNFLFFEEGLHSLRTWRENHYPLIN